MKSTVSFCPRSPAFASQTVVSNKMSQKKLLIAKVLPLMANVTTDTRVPYGSQKFIEIKIKNIANLKDMQDVSDKCADNAMADKPKRKRERLDHLSNDEKIKRRKLHNRAAAQLARDRKKHKMSELQETVREMKQQKRLLEGSNEALITRCRALERENADLKRRLSEVSAQSAGVVEGSDGIVESAELINVSQPQKHETRAPETTARPAPHSTTPFIYWLAVLNLIQCWNSSKSALKSCSTTTPTLPALMETPFVPQSSPMAIAQECQQSSLPPSLLNT
ncbi:unnamed protein product [Oppiella nova]|uniref:X-box-binding protein 1 n=1 Tax=Oppiella nova TaxID=334625 RepID=A0A7R9MGY4_9ACAR|nr:unnamed protein product [Oppiella nova]CAG2177066.1 unnamed protein product [Oppiella nova]